MEPASIREQDPQSWRKGYAVDAQSRPWVTHPWVAAGDGAIRFGVGVSARAPMPDWAVHLALVRELEALGFDAHWFPDHPAVAADCWATLAALAVSTTRIRLGPFVSCAGYRPPVLLARLATDVDRLSGGRLVLGMGCGWIAPEFGWLGLPFPPVPERQRMLAEAVEIVLGLWGTAPGAVGPADTSFLGGFSTMAGPPPLTYHGAHYHLEGALLRPGPIQAPRVPVLIAGGGERVTLRQVARYADAANFGMQPVSGSAPAIPTVADVRRKLAVLRQHCDEIDRPFPSVLPTYFTNPVLLAESAAKVEAKRAALPATFRDAEGLFGTPADAIAYYRPLVDSGLRYFIANLATFEDVETARLLAERVLPELG